jgi:hypothetical protein
LSAHALLHLLFGSHLQISAELLIQLLIDLFLSEQGSEAACDIPQHGHE